MPHKAPVINDHQRIICLTELTENMIRWAEDKLGSKEYAGWCLTFIEDALEKSNGIEIFGGNSAKESALLYADGMCQGIPERGAFVFYDCICLSPDGLVNWAIAVSASGTEGSSMPGTRYGLTITGISML